MVVYSGGNSIHCYELFICFLYCIGSHCLWSRLDRLHTELLDFVLSSFVLYVCLGLFSFPLQLLKLF